MGSSAGTVKTTPPPPHIVIFPSPGMGHLIPLTELAKRLVHRFSFTFAVPTTGPPSSAQLSFLSSLPSAIDTVYLPSADISDAPSDVRIETITCLMVTRSLPSLRDFIAAQTRPVVALVVDLFGTDAFDVAVELGVRPYLFFSSTAMSLSLFLHLEKLDETVSSEFYEMTEPVEIPGCIPVQGRDLVDSVQDRKNDAYKWLLHHCKRYRLAEGIILNSFDALEGGAIKALTQLVYPVGPLVQTSSAAGIAPGGWCLDWLDKQPPGSVLFVNFGSGGTLTTEQQKELAYGLARSQQRFLWVVKAPNDAVASGAYFTVDGETDPLMLLPDGFVEEAKGRGLVVPKWAPQIEILTHQSTGGFLMHCGWNSVLESVVNGVPVITWPLYAEEKMNAAILTDDLRVGLRPKADTTGIVRSDEIERVVRELMGGEQGKRLRSRIQVLKSAASVALGEHGSSTNNLHQLSKIWEETMV